MMGYCEVFATEEEAIAVCREVNRRRNSKDPAGCAFVDGPEDNYAVVDLDTVKDLLEFGDPASSGLTHLSRFDLHSDRRIA